MEPGLEVVEVQMEEHWNRNMCLCWDGVVLSIDVVVSRTNFRMEMIQVLWRSPQDRDDVVGGFVGRYRRLGRVATTFVG